MRDEYNPETFSNTKESYKEQLLKAFQNLSIFRGMYRKLASTRFLVIIKSRVTSSDITSSSTRTLEMKKTRPNLSVGEVS